MMHSGTKKEEVEVPTPTLPEGKPGSRSQRGKKKPVVKKTK